MLYMIVVKGGNRKSFYHTEPFFFYFVSICDDGCSLNLLCNFMMYAVHPEVIQC